MNLAARTTLAALVIAFIATPAHGQVTLTRGTNFSVDVSADGRIAFDLLGTIRILPAGGGLARNIPDTPPSARRPRWSPDSTRIAFQARDGGQEHLWLYNLDDGTVSRLSPGDYFDHHPDWHPDGDRVVFSSDRHDSGFDIWEMDVPTGLSWRLSQLPGDETEPAWSANGEDLLFVHHVDDKWALVLRRRGQADRVLVSSEVRLSSPSWRPDGSLVTFQRHLDDGIVTEMAILSDPLLVRPLIQGEDFFVAPIAWRDRQVMFYASNGHIRQRNFNAWTSRNVPFRVNVRPQTSVAAKPPAPRDLPPVDSPQRRWILRAARLFDGIGGGYRRDTDIVIDGGRIAAVESRRDRQEAIVIDMGDLTVLPGFIDAAAELPAPTDVALGPPLLALGLTTIVADTNEADRLNASWSGEDVPGPLVLGRDWRLELDTVNALTLSVDTLPTSPQGIRYEDARLGSSVAPASVLSGLADAHTPGIAELLRSRQAQQIGIDRTSVRRFSETPQLSEQSTSIVLGSEPNGLGPGIGLHAELRALQNAGLDPEHVLRTAGINAAAALGLGLRIGRIAPGATADLVIVDGDPLTNIADTLKVVGVVRNGRFFSVVGLLERHENAAPVE